MLTKIIGKLTLAAVLSAALVSCSGGGSGGGCEYTTPGAGSYETGSGEEWLAMPGVGNLYVRVLAPKRELYTDICFPALITVPGGWGDGAPMADSPEYKELAGMGFVVVAYNAPGRGTGRPGNLRSDGEQGFNGYTDQDALKTVVEHVHSMQGVDPDDIGVQTGSFGISVGAGALGRHTDLPVKYLVDVEGPSECFNIAFETWALDADPGNDKHDWFRERTGRYCTSRDPSPDNEAWWEEREALRYIGKIKARYLRVQNMWDHAQAPNMQNPSWDYPPLWYANKHAVDMINAATQGESPWTRVNGETIGNPINTTYDRQNPPAYYQHRQNGVDRGEINPLIIEMAVMPPLD